MVYDEKEDVDFAKLSRKALTSKNALICKLCRSTSQRRGVSASSISRPAPPKSAAAAKRGRFPTRTSGCSSIRMSVKAAAIAVCNPTVCRSVPKETELGRKRAIDQSSCNKDFSCVKGFCPSFVSLEGAIVRKEATTELKLPDLPAP